MMRKKSPYEKSALAKILKAEKRRKGIALLKSYEELGMGQVAFLRRLQMKDKTLKDMLEGKKIAAFFGIPEESVALSSCGEDVLALLFYEYPSIISFLKDLYEKSKTSNIEDFISLLPGMLKDYMDRVEILSKFALVKKMYLRGEDIATIAKATGLTYQTVLLRLKVIKDIIDMDKI